ncbi:MAG: histidine phosphatase family protein [Boseongicola sp.]|nr:histidine phosphatase family protein [Boseongicola sp.]
MFSSTELVLVRHADADTGGRLCGRTDVGLADSAAEAMSGLARMLPSVDQIWTSPALRCRLTASHLWPRARLLEDERLQEQDFGAWEGRAHEDIPYLGDISRSELASLRPEGGESFDDLCQRAGPALRTLAEMTEAGPVVAVTHAGIVRAALSMVLGETTAGLAFEVRPLSVTRFRCAQGAPLSVAEVNWRPA